MIELFSPTFATDIWANQSAEVSADRPFSDEQVRDALLGYTQRPAALKELNRHSEAVSAINGVRTPQAQPELLIQGRDASLTDYVERADAFAGTDEWSVAYFGLFAASSTMWDTAKIFADKLALTLGYRPGGRVDIDCFVGRYSSTHTGVHVDYAHNFAFTLRDGKTMFTWPGDRNDLHGLKSPEYDHHKSSATALGNKTDRVAYFPQEYMHVAESKDDVSVNVNVTFWESGNDSKSNADYLRTLLRTPERTRHDVRRSGSVTLGSDNDFVLSTVRSLLDDGTLKRRMAVSQLISDTSSRIGVGRPLEDIAEVPETAKLTCFSTLQWMPMNGLEEVLVAANGHVAAFPYSRDLDEFLSQLAEGKTLDTGWLRETNLAKTGQTIRKVVIALARWGAL